MMSAHIHPKRQPCGVEDDEGDRAKKCKEILKGKYLNALCITQNDDEGDRAKKGKEIMKGKYLNSLYIT